MPIALFIIGPGAVGKYSVGRCIAEKMGDDWALAHNHQAIELAYEMYPAADASDEIDWALVSTVRNAICEYLMCKKKNVIHTAVMRNRELDFLYLRREAEEYRETGYRICVLALTAPFKERKKRNIEISRLEAKPSKRNIECSEEILNEEMEQNVLEYPTIEQLASIFEIPTNNILVMDTTEKTVEQEANEAISVLELQAHLD